MTRTERLPLARPAAAAGAPQGIWIADAASKALVLFDAATAAEARRIDLTHTPAALAATPDVVAAATENGEIVAFDASDARLRWRKPAAHGRVQLAAWGDRVWAWDRDGSTFLTWSAAGDPEVFDAAGATAFAPGADGVYWLSSGGLAAFTSVRGLSRKARLPDHVPPAGAILACGNVLFVSITNGLLLASLDTLEPRTTVRTPEGPVSHLVCHHRRIFGGELTVFALEPAADDNARALPVTLDSPLLGIAVSGTHLWAVESAASRVHIVSIP